MSTLRVLLALAAATGAGIALAGCSAPAPAETDPGAGAGADPFLSAVLQPADSFPLPDDPIEGVQEFAGETVFYVPITLRAPTFVATQAALQEAFAGVGLTVQSCPVDGNPANIAACADQAIAAGAVGIIADALPYQMGAEAFTGARAAGLKVVISNQGPDDPDFPADDTLAYIPSGAGNMDRAMLHWIAQDSGGDATILVSRSADGFWSNKFMTDALDELPGYCAGCTVVGPVDVSTATQGQLQAGLAAELISDPDIGYLVTDFAQYLPQAAGAIADSGRTDIQLLTGAGSMGAIQGVGEGAYAAVAAEATAFIGWQQADTLLRLLAGAEVAEIDPGTTPIRLFTKDTLPENLSEGDALELSGEWFGPASFKDDYLALWT